MIAKLCGIVEDIYAESIIVMICGIGYHVIIPKSFIKTMILHQKVKLYIAPITNEYNTVFYGFETSTQKNCFNELISVNGVGPKIAINIISNIQIEAIINAINNQDKRAFKAIGGVGDKTAERIILELKNKDVFRLDSISPGQTMDVSCQDAIDALVQLGINYTQAMSQVLDAKKVLQNSDTSSLIAYVLRHMKK